MLVPIMASFNLCKPSASRGIFSNTRELLLNTEYPAPESSPSTSASKALAREALAEADAELSQAGLQAAIRLKDEKAGELLLAGLESTPVSDWSEASLEALAKLQTRAAVAVFRKAMASAPKETKLAMLRAAKRIGGKEATRFLVETSMAGEAEVSRTASQLLRSR